ncbi:ATP/GTP-binding protein [Streptomyces sp. NPDC102451]|uniref:ATP/GTP-binding protein n=1 Tax=Streptomyces sp. NPDC102451 TaxID=3366177 RepID=UPI00382011D3
MNDERAHRVRDTSGAAWVPGPGDGSRPPRPRYAPAAGPPLGEWLRTPRPPQEPGVWRYGYTPRPPREPEGVPDHHLLLGLLISVVSGVLVVFVWYSVYNPYRLVPVKLFTPSDWWNIGISGGPRTVEGAHASTIYQGVLFWALAYACGRLGNWAELFRRRVASRGQPFLGLVMFAAAVLAQLLVWKSPLPVVEPVLALIFSVAGGEIFQSQALVNMIYAVIAAGALWPFARLGRWRELAASYIRRRRGLAGEPVAVVARHTPPAAPLPAQAPHESPAHWPQLRAGGQGEAADVLAAAVRDGLMNDVDCARIQHAWAAAGARPDGAASFAQAVRRDGAGAALHPSGHRDLPLRRFTHDLLAQQVRIGFCADDEHNPYERRGSGMALDPGLLGTSLLAVGPSGAGKTARLVAPVVESLALQALAGTAAVVAVGRADAPLGPDEAYDIVVKPGDPTSVHDLDLYGGTVDADEAGSVLAEGLVGDVEAVDSRRAATALAQLLGPYRAVHGRFPEVPVLRELLEGAPAVLAALRAGLEAGNHSAMLRELDARERQAGGAGDPGPVLADRIALLDRPVFAGFFATGSDSRPFSLRSLGQLPLRVRVDLPERAHAEASRLLARLLLAQFNAVAAARADRTLFVCLVLDDATHTLTEETIRGIRRLRSLNAGVVLSLRTVDDVPDRLDTALLGAVGCCMVFSGVTTWDGKRFVEVWGKEWIETREVAQHTVFADQPFTRALHGLRRLVTGKDKTTAAVTVRRVERERWSPSELAYTVPSGHAVLSLTSVQGTHAPPLLVELGN